MKRRDSFIKVIVEMIIFLLSAKTMDLWPYRYKWGGFVKVKVIGNPVNTKKIGIRVPCMYIINGQESFIQDLNNNVVWVFWKKIEIIYISFI